MRVAVLILAAGAGVRLGHALPKALVAVRGRSLVARSAAIFAEHPGVRDVVVVAPGEAVAEVMAMSPPGAVVVGGGATRQASVRAGLAAVAADIEFVLIHDSARAFLPPDVIDRVLQGLLDGADAVIPVLPMLDAVKRVDASGAVLETLDRAALRLVQTPQGFPRALIDRAHAAARAAGQDDAVDDAALLEALGARVLTVPGDPLAFKITLAADLARAEATDG